MGLLGSKTQGQYYGETDKGNYQFVALSDIINSFMLMYIGEDKIINKANLMDVRFHGMRAIQELSYDVLRSYKSFEQEVPATLVMPLPQDYVNYTSLSIVDSSGTERVLYPTKRTSNPFPIKQNSDGTYQFTVNNAGTPEDNSDDYNEDLIVQGSDTDANNPYTSETRDKFSSVTSSNVTTDYDDSDHNLVDSRGRRYGLDPVHAQANGTFYIDNATGFIHFGSSLAGETVVLKYISDGLGQDSEMIVHKFCEEAVYKHIMYGLISSKSNMPEYIVQRFKKEKFAETRKAKIRLSNIKMEEFTQVLKGISKFIK